MTTMKCMRRAIALYRNPLIARAAQRRNQREYLRALAYLGDKWVFAKKIERTN